MARHQGLPRRRSGDSRMTRKDEYTHHKVGRAPFTYETIWADAWPHLEDWFKTRVIYSAWDSRKAATL